MASNKGSTTPEQLEGVHAGKIPMDRGRGVLINVDYGPRE